MNIAICLYKYFPYGGLQRDFYRIADVLVRRGHYVRVYTREWNSDERPSGLDIVVVPTHAFTNHAKNVQYYKWVQNHLSKHPVDRVVGFNKMPNLDVYYGADVCFAEKNQNKSWIYKLTGRYKHYLEFEKCTVGAGIKNKLMIITPNQKKEFQKHYGREDDRFYLLTPGISLDRKYSNFSKDSREKFRLRHKLSEDDFLLLQIGSDFKRKGVDRSICALASLPEFVRKRTFLYVVGQDSEKQFVKLAKKLKVDSNVCFLGGRDDIPDFIAGSDLLLHPARSENTGTVILEALAGGLPEIVTDVCGYSTFVDSADTGLVLNSPYDQTQFNAYLLKSLDRSVLDRWRKNAQIYADTRDLYSLPERAADIILE